MSYNVPFSEYPDGNTINGWSEDENTLLHPIARLWGWDKTYYMIERPQAGYVSFSLPQYIDYHNLPARFEFEWLIDGNDIIWCQSFSQWELGYDNSSINWAEFPLNDMLPIFEWAEEAIRKEFGLC